MKRLTGALALALVLGMASKSKAQGAGGDPPEPPPPATAEPAPPPAPPPAAPTAAPTAAAPAAPTAAPPPASDVPPPPQGTEYDEPPPPDGGGYGYVPPPEKPRSKVPPLSFRVDPFNWLLEGRLGVEAEVGLLDFLSVEVVPVFVANDKPPTLDFRGAQSKLYQESRGIGPMSGGAIDLGFWLDGKPLHGYVLRAGITNEAYAYKTKDDVGEVDSVNHTERRAFFMFGSHSTWGAFTISGGIGLGVELNKQERCFPTGATSVTSATTANCDKQLLISLDRQTKETLDLNGALYPISIMGRFSLGVVFD